MKKPHLILVLLILLGVLLSSCQNAPKPSETVVPQSDTTVPTDGEKRTLRLNSPLPPVNFSWN